jgi:hypothetical protein
MLVSGAAVACLAQGLLRMALKKDLDGEKYIGNRSKRDAHYLRDIGPCQIKFLRTKSAVYSTIWKANIGKLLASHG